MSDVAISRLSPGLVNASDRARVEAALVEMASDGRLPPAFAEQITAQFRALARGKDLLVFEAEAVLTTTQASQLLGFSRPHLVKLCDRNEIGFHFVGSDRRFRMSDIELFIDRRDANRRRTEDLLSSSKARRDVDVARRAGVSLEKAKELGL